MTATDELRKLLDERGVEYATNHGYHEYLWDFGEQGTARASYIGTKGLVQMIVTGITPEQAIAATLGRGTCELHGCEGSFSAVNKPVWRCDCGAFMTQYTDATTYHKPRYCPNCGARVERREQ